MLGGRAAAAAGWSAAGTAINDDGKLGGGRYGDSRLGGDRRYGNGGLGGR